MVLVWFVVAALVHPSCRSFSEYVEHTDVSGPPHYHKRQWFQASDSVYSGRISSIPNGYHLFRTDSVYSERMQDIRGVSGEFIAFHMHLYSSAVFPVLDRIRYQSTSIPHINFRPA